MSVFNIAITVYLPRDANAKVATKDLSAATVLASHRQWIQIGPLLLLQSYVPCFMISPKFFEHHYGKLDLCIYGWCLQSHSLLLHGTVWPSFIVTSFFPITAQSLYCMCEIHNKDYQHVLRRCWLCTNFIKDCSVFATHDMTHVRFSLTHTVYQLCPGAHQQVCGLSDNTK